MNHRLDELNELERFSGYFSPAELKAIDRGRSLPGLDIEKLKFTRVAGVVLDSLTSTISPDSPIEVDGPTIEENLLVGTLIGDIAVNDSWYLNVDILASGDENSSLIASPKQVRGIVAWWHPNEPEHEQTKTNRPYFMEDFNSDVLGSTYFSKPEGNVFWLPDTDPPLKQQISLLLLLGDSQQVPLPFAD